MADRMIPLGAATATNQSIGSKPPRASGPNGESLMISVPRLIDMLNFRRGVLGLKTIQ